MRLELFQLVREEEQGIHLALDNHRRTNLITTEPARGNASHVRVQDASDGRLGSGGRDDFKDLTLEESLELRQQVLNFLLPRVMGCKCYTKFGVTRHLARLKFKFHMLKSLRTL